jgi:hypothetical protein
MANIVRISPFFVPDPGVLIQAEKFPAITLWNIAKERSAHFGAVTNKVTMDLTVTGLLVDRQDDAEKFTKH